MQTAPSVTAPLFSASLRPHRSLSVRGQRLVIVLVAGLAAIPGLAFYSLGAWPIIGFMGLDALAVLVAFAVFSRRQKSGERVTLFRDALEVVKIDARGTEKRHKFQPFFVRLIIERDFEERTTALRLRSQDGEIEIGAFLKPEERASFAQAFGTALRKARAKA